MPKKRFVGGQLAPAGDTFTRPIGTWVATGVSLAVIGVTTQLGVFTVYGVVLLSPMVYVFARLHRQAPDARTTSDLLAAVLGERFGVFAGLLQLVAYLVIGAKFARLVAVSLLGQFLSVDASAPIGWFVVGSIAAVVSVAIIIYLLSARGIAWVAAILAAVGMLVYFYLALTVDTLIASGHKPHGISMPATPHVTYGAADVLLATSLVVGFEVLTTVNRDVRAVGRSIGLAFAMTAGIAVMVAAAVSPRLFRSLHMPSDVSFPSLVDAYLGNAGDWLLIGNLAFACAALLMLTFGALRVAQRLAEQFDVPTQQGGRLAGVVGIIGVLVIVDWLWAGFAAFASKLDDAGPLLLLAVYACAAHACARIQTARPRIAAQAAQWFVWVLVAAIVVIGLVRSRSDAAGWWPIGIGGGVLLAAAAIAVKTERLPRTPNTREECVTA